MKHEPLSRVTAPHSQRAVGGNERTFTRLYRRLQSIAYRMLGSVAEAEDIVQDTWLRWNAAAGQVIENEEAWLVSVTTRLSVDRLRVIKMQREHHSELWLSEFQMTESPTTPQEIHERADDVSMAYLILLEQLTPMARAAFLMHEIFEIDYDQIAQMLHKTQEACRQLVRRAKVQLRSERSCSFVPQETHQHLLNIFIQALERADLAEIGTLLVEDAMLMGNSSEVREGSYSIIRSPHFASISKFLVSRLTDTPRSGHTEPSINGKHLAGDPGSIRRRQRNDPASHILR